MTRAGVIQALIELAPAPRLQENGSEALGRLAKAGLVFDTTSVPWSNFSTEWLQEWLVGALDALGMAYSVCGDGCSVPGCGDTPSLPAASQPPFPLSPQPVGEPVGRLKQSTSTAKRNADGSVSVETTESWVGGGDA